MVKVVTTIATDAFPHGIRLSPDGQQAYVANLYNSKSVQYAIKPRLPDTVFTPDAMAGEGIR